MQEIFARIVYRGIGLLLGLALLFALPTATVEVQGAKTYQANGVTLPLKGYGNGSASYGKSNCRAFAGMVYKQIWGTTFTSYRGTDDDMLREVPTGAARAITAENVEKFISAAALGAAIRITNDIRGNDVYGTYLHSQILIQKDAKGFTIYESIDTCIRIKYYTWEAYASAYQKYKYFKYIKWPKAPKYDEHMEEAPAISVFQMGLLGSYVTLESNAEDVAIYYTTDGTTPTADSTLYTGMFTADAGDVVKAVAVKENYGNSPMATQAVTGVFTFCSLQASPFQISFFEKYPKHIWNPVSFNRYGTLAL